MNPLFDDEKLKKEMLHGIVSMLVGLIRSNSATRLHEEATSYRAAGSGTERGAD